MNRKKLDLKGKLKDPDGVEIGALFIFANWRLFPHRRQHE
jgi:hypothetical protein